MSHNQSMIVTKTVIMKKPSDKIIEVASCKISNPDSGELKSKFDRSTFDQRSLSLKQF